MTGFDDPRGATNSNEPLVWAAIEEYLSADAGACRCRDCILDMVAIALNRLPPRYEVCSFHKHGPAQEEAAYQALVREAVSAAALVVAKRPHHL